MRRIVEISLSPTECENMCMHRTSWIVGLIAGSILTACSGNLSVSMRSTQPDKALFNHAKDAIHQTRFDVANLDLQTRLNTYPTSEYAAEATSLLQDPRIANCGRFSTTPEECDGEAQPRPSL